MAYSLDELIPADKALEIVLSGEAATRIVSLPLVQAANLVLAEDLVALRTQPPFNASAMDGYAINSKSLKTLPATVTQIGVSRAGHPFDGKVATGQAVRIFTGAVVPEGADTIIIQENAEASEDSVKILANNSVGKFIRPAGLDFREGDVLLHKGDTLTPFRLALAASMNHANVKVYDRPRLALIATGDELVLPGQFLEAGQIIASNTFGLNAAATGAGAEVEDFGIAPDTEDGLREIIQSAIHENADIIVTTGGASVGDHDLVMPVARSLGFEFEIAKIKMRPGKPFLFGKLHRDNRIIHLVGLAGNPVSSMIAFNVFVKPLISKRAGRPQEQIMPLTAFLAEGLPANDERMEFMRGKLETRNDGTQHVSAFTKQDSSMLTNLVRADCLIIRPANAKASPKGEACDILLLD